MSYRIGDKVRILRELHGHEYEIMDIVTITHIDVDDYDDTSWYTGVEDSNYAGGYWFKEDEIEFISRSIYKEGDKVWIKSNSNCLPGINLEAVLTRPYGREKVWNGTIEGRGPSWVIKECDIIPLEFNGKDKTKYLDITECVDCKTVLTKIEDDTIYAECPGCLALYSISGDKLAA